MVVLYVNLANLNVFKVLRHSPWFFWQDLVTRAGRFRFEKFASITVRSVLFEELEKKTHYRSSGFARYSWSKNTLDHSMIDLDNQYWDSPNILHGLSNTFTRRIHRKDNQILNEIPWRLGTWKRDGKTKYCVCLKSQITAGNIVASRFWIYELALFYRNWTDKTCKNLKMQLFHYLNIIVR